MKFNLLKLIILLWPLLACTTPKIKNDKKFVDAPYVILISIDGFRHDYVQKYKPTNLSQIKSHTSAKGLIPVFPSKTFPNHYSIATGLKAGKHEIVSNNFLDPETNELYSLRDRTKVKNGKWYKGEPLWISASKQGMVTASYFWVGTDASIQNRHPHYYKDYDGKVPNRERVEQVLAWLRLPKEQRPHLITLYFSIVDSKGHRHGPDSKEVKTAIFEVDDLLGHLRQELKRMNLPVNLVIVSDHGMEPLNERSAFYMSEFYVPEEGVKVIGGGSWASVYVKNKSKIPEILKKFQKSSKIEAYTRKTVPNKYGIHQSPKAGDILLAIKPPYYMLTSDQRPKSSVRGGTHGYDPHKYKNMWGIFYAEGPNFKRKHISQFENIHIYPMIHKLLGLKVKTDIDGDEKVLAPLLK